VGDLGSAIAPCQSVQEMIARTRRPDAGPEDSPARSAEGMAPATCLASSFPSNSASNAHAGHRAAAQRLPTLPPYSPQGLAPWAAVVSHVSPVPMRGGMVWGAPGVSISHMGSGEFKAGWGQSDGWGLPHLHPIAMTAASPRVMYTSVPPPPVEMASSMQCAAEMSNLAETAMALAQLERLNGGGASYARPLAMRTTATTTTTAASHVYQQKPASSNADASHGYVAVHSAAPRTQQHAHPSWSSSFSPVVSRHAPSRLSVVVVSDGAGGATAEEPPRPVKRPRIRGAARARAEANEDWLRSMPRFEGFAPDPPGGWASHEDLILASIPQEALALDRKKFNIWKRANAINFKGERQRALTKIRRNELARRYARLARARKRIADAEGRAVSSTPPRSGDDDDDDDDDDDVDDSDDADDSDEGVGETN
jgi:hypothetical protein